METILQVIKDALPTLYEQKTSSTSNSNPQQVLLSTTMTSDAHHLNTTTHGVLFHTIKNYINHSDTIRHVTSLVRKLGESIQGHQTYLSKSAILGIVVPISILILLLLLLDFILLPQKQRKQGYQKDLLRHAIITGGSSGIGRAIAKELVQRHCSHVTILARNRENLKETKEFLEQCAKDMASPTIISIYSVDVSNAKDIQQCAAEICQNSNVPTPTLLFNVAGTSSAKSFLETNVQEFERLMSINYFGTVYTIHAFLPYMLQGKNHSTQHATTTNRTDADMNRTEISTKGIVLTSSAAGQVGVFGYSAYSPTKYALRGLAEVLQMELLRDHIYVQVAYPPDTDTPGYQLEQLEKPEETHRISQAAGLFPAERVAKGIVKSALAARPPFSIYFGLEGWMLATLTSGMSPVHTLIDVLAQIFLKGLFRFISLFFLMDFRNIVHNVRENQRKKTNVPPVTLKK